MGRQPIGGCLSFLRRGQKKGLETNLQEEIVQEIEALLGRQAIADLDFEAVEMVARRQALRLAARALEQRLNADTSDHAGPKLPCSYGALAQYRGRHEKTFASVLGPLRLERAYYHCAQCRGGFCQRDRALRLEFFSLTPGVLRMTVSTAALASFEESSTLLHELAGWRSASARCKERPKRWAPKSLPTNAPAWRDGAKSLRLCTWGWMAPACRCIPRKSLAGLANSRMAPQEPARPSSSPCGPRNRGTRRASRCGILGRSLIRPPLKSAAVTDTQSHTI